MYVCLREWDDCFLLGVLLGMSWGGLGASWAVYGACRVDRRQSRAALGGPGSRRPARSGPEGAGSLPLLAFPASAGGGVVGEMTLGSSLASHISLSSAKARCHCLPFSHALIPAL